MNKTEQKVLDWFDGRDPKRAQKVRTLRWYERWNDLAGFLSKAEMDNKYKRSKLS